MMIDEQSPVLLAFASWEDRFVQGVADDLSHDSFGRVLIFYFISYGPKTETARTVVREKCVRLGLEYKEICLNADRPHENLRTVSGTLETLSAASPLVIDISTMPREVIWYIFWLSEHWTAPVRYRYHSPAEYSREWLSRDPGRPRLVHKLSGIARPGAKTALIVAVGFDVQRVWQLVRHFEPAKFFVALQIDSPFAVNRNIMRKYVDQLHIGESHSKFEIDAFGDDHGYGAFERQLSDIVEDYNVVLSSLGPKLTAVSLYRLQRRWPEVGLVYAPAKEFNREYSRGIGRLFVGDLHTNGGYDARRVPGNECSSVNGRPSVGGESA